MQTNGGIDWNSDPDFYLPPERMSSERFEDRFPELCRRFLDPETVAVLEPAPPQTQVAYEEIFHEEIRADLCKFGLDPFFKRYALYIKRLSQYGNGEDPEKGPAGEGIVWERVLTFTEAFDPLDPLPKDLQELNHDGRYDHFAGTVGDFCIPNREDMYSLKKAADHHMNSGKTLQHVAGWAAKLIQKREDSRKSFLKSRRDMWRDFFSHNKLRYARYYDRVHDKSQNKLQMVVDLPGGIADRAGKQLEAENWHTIQGKDADGNVLDYKIRTPKPRPQAPELPMIWFDQDGRRQVQTPDDRYELLKAAADQNASKLEVWNRLKEEALKARKEAQAEVAQVHLELPESEHSTARAALNTARQALKTGT